MSTGTVPDAQGGVIRPGGRNEGWRCWKTGDRWLLRGRNKKEGERVSVVEEPIPRANDGLRVRRIGDSDSRLDSVMVGIHKKPESSLEVIPRAIVQRELGGDAPLVLSEEAVVAVIQVHEKVLCLVRPECILPCCPHGR